MKKTIKLTEADLTKLVKESVKTILGEMNEISSDMIGRATKKFHQRYGVTDFPGPDAKGFPKDKNGNLLYPKDMKPLATHYRNFNDAYDRAKRDEDMTNPLLQKAFALYQDADFSDEEQFDNYEHGYGEFGDYAEVEDENGGIWKFYRTFNGHYEGGSVEMDELEGVEFETPDGETSSFNPNNMVNENRVIKINENTIKRIITQGVRKVLKEMAGTDEISSDMIGRAMDKFHDKYGQRNSSLKPKDKRTAWDHELDFAAAYNQAKSNETTDDLGREAYNVFRNIDFSKEYMEGCEGDDWEYEGGGSSSSCSTGHVEKDGWKFDFPIRWSSYSVGMGSEMDWDFIGDKTPVTFISPDGRTGKFMYHTYHPYSRGKYTSPKDIK